MSKRTTSPDTTNGDTPNSVTLADSSAKPGHRRTPSMDEVVSPYVLPPNTFLYVSFGLLLVQGFLFAAECMWRTITSDYARPVYADHDHHLCHALVMILALFAVWYLTIVFLLVRHNAAAVASTEAWIFNLLGLPTALVALAETATFAYLWSTYDDHREQPFANAISFGSGALLIGIAWWGLTLAHVPLRQGRAYAWHWLSAYGAFLAAYVGLCLYNNLVLPTFIGGLVLVPYAFGMYESRQQLHAKKLV